MIKYIEGDLFAEIKEVKDKLVVIPHVCNNQKKFGAGFVVPLAKHFPMAKQSYMSKSQLELGEVIYVKTGNVLICNMIAQELGGIRPLFYNHLAACLTSVANTIKNNDELYEIHAPAFGTNLAGGSWNVILPLIEDAWIRSGIKNINIYFLPGTFLPPDLK